MGQSLIQAVNVMTVSASYLNPAYESKFGFKHYGFDCYGTSTTIWSQGYGAVLATGTDSCYGNYVTVMYFDVESAGNVVANYFHLASIDVKAGQFVTKDTRLGVMGKTGTYATGVHLHTEMRKYALGQAALLSPFGTNAFKQDLAAGWFDPLSIIFCKTSTPDSQKYSTTNDAYINDNNKTIRTLV
jgi:murein DD-endopeptidase MepM/ murein hydrolase activator NlpD